MPPAEIRLDEDCVPILDLFRGKRSITWEYRGHPLASGYESRTTSNLSVEIRAFSPSITAGRMSARHNFKLIARSSLALRYLAAKYGRFLSVCSGLPKP